MAHEKEKRQSPEQISSKQNKPQMEEDYDPLSEESTDYRAPGEKFETFGEGENLDRTRLDQPRHDPESIPEAHKDLGFATRRVTEVNDEEEKRLYEERQKRLKKVA
ncbi:MAG: hypothetical protein ACE14M_15545 [Terriglobales bacterium]